MRAKEFMNTIGAAGIISLNGAKTVYQDKIISEYVVEEDKAIQLVRMLLAVPGTFVNVTYPDVILTNNKALVTGNHVHQYTDYTEIDTKEIAKVSITTDHPEFIKNIVLLNIIVS